MSICEQLTAWCKEEVSDDKLEYYVGENAILVKCANNEMTVVKRVLSSKS